MGRKERRQERKQQEAGRVEVRTEAPAVAYLRSLTPPELVRVLQQVFADRVPFPSEAGFCRSKFYLGIAYSHRESDPGEPEAWEPWQFKGAAYHRPQDHAGGPGDLGQSGGCGGCSLGLHCNLKGGVCPVCGREVGLT